jgi:hypothetical protein
MSSTIESDALALYGRRDGGALRCYRRMFAH